MIVKALSNGMNFIPSYFVLIVYVHLFFLIDFNMNLLLLFIQSTLHSTESRLAI